MNSNSFTKNRHQIVSQANFGFESDMQVGAFSNEYVPKIDHDYKFDKDTT